MYAESESPIVMNTPMFPLTEEWSYNNPGNSFPRKNHTEGIFYVAKQLQCRTLLGHFLM